MVTSSSSVKRYPKLSLVQTPTVKLSTEIFLSAYPWRIGRDKASVFYDNLILVWERYDDDRTLVVKEVTSLIESRIKSEDAAVTQMLRSGDYSVSQCVLEILRSVAEEESEADNLIMLAELHGISRSVLGTGLAPYSWFDFVIQAACKVERPLPGRDEYMYYDRSCTTHGS